MKRPRQHTTETESKKSLNSIIPDNWVLRELAPDYGLDYMVEIFKKEKAISVPKLDPDLFGFTKQGNPTLFTISAVSMRSPLFK